MGLLSLPSFMPIVSEIQSVRNDLFFALLALYLLSGFVSQISPTCFSRDRAYRASSISTIKASPSYSFVSAFVDASAVS
jgi:hypothetical protein